MSTNVGIPLQIQYTYTNILYLWIKQSTSSVIARFKSRTNTSHWPGAPLDWCQIDDDASLTNDDSKTFLWGVLMEIYVIQFFLFSNWSSSPFKYRNTINPLGKFIYYVVCLRK